MSPPMRIAEELAGKHIFVTGGSGFMGKVLVEKLLRSCPDVACVYLLMRPKKGVAVQERINTIINTALFQPLLQANPEAVAKLRAVEGDCSVLGLGLSADDEALLVEEVSYVFHAAATVRFDDPLKAAILLNTRGTREVVELCKKMKKLKAMQYVSTTYCFTSEPVLKEQHYDTDLDWRTMIRLAETEDKYTLDTLTHKILGFQPNTYTFTKALAESIINDARHDMPVMIFRPAVVISTIVEPFPGWLDNLNGPFGIWAGALKGVLRFSWGNPDVALSYTPVDWAIRGMIACAVAKGNNSPALGTTSKEVDVVNMEGSTYERQTFGLQMQNFKVMRATAPNAVRYPSYHIGTCFAYYWLGTVFSELPYGLVLDTLLRLSGSKPRMIATYRKIFAANNALAYFMLHEFPIVTEKIDIIHQAIHPADKPAFGLCVNDGESCINYDPVAYRLAVLKGAFKYVFNEEASEEDIRQRLRKLFALEWTMRGAACYLLYLTAGKFLMWKISSLGSIFSMEENF